MKPKTTFSITRLSLLPEFALGVFGVVGVEGIVGSRRAKAMLVGVWGMVDGGERLVESCSSWGEDWREEGA